MRLTLVLCNNMTQTLVDGWILDASSSVILKKNATALLIFAVIWLSSHPQIL